MSDVMKQYNAWVGIFEKSPDAASVHPMHTKFLNYYNKQQMQNKEKQIQAENKKFFGLF
tara:strand:- start:1745 stop:1921 length:177 start_codon:yes stop_codon:yes gene_type:complete